MMTKDPIALKVNNGFDTFWVKNPKKIKYYMNLSKHPKTSIKILKTI